MKKGRSDSSPDNKKEHSQHLDLANHYQSLPLVHAIVKISCSKSERNKISKAIAPKDATR